MSDNPPPSDDPMPQKVLLWCAKFDALIDLMGRKPQIKNSNGLMAFVSPEWHAYGDWKRELEIGFGYVLPRLIETAKAYRNIDSGPLIAYLEHFQKNPPGYWQCEQLIRATETVTEIKVEAERRSTPLQTNPVTGELEADYKTARWFQENTTISGESLRQAVSDGKFLPTVGTKGKKRYSLRCAKLIWGNDIMLDD